MSSLVSIPSGSTDLRQIVFGVNQALQQWGATGPSSGLLQAANNLSDVASASISLANLGITTGTSGHVVPFLDGINSFSAAQAFKAPVTGYEINGFGYIAPGVNGVIGNGSTDDTAAIQAIFNAYNNIYIDAGKYLISATLTITIGNPARVITGAGAQFASGVLQNGAFFIAAASFTGSAAIEIASSAGNAAVYAIGGFAITNHTAGSGASYGIEVTSPGGNNKNYIHDVISAGFAFNFLVYNSRSIVWERCASWNLDLAGSSTASEWGWYLQVGASGFTGDMDFESCETRASSTGGGTALTDQGAAGAGLGGIRFRNHTAYLGLNGMSINLSGAGSLCEDVWVSSGSQFEGQGSGTVAFNMAASASGATIEDIHIDHCYMAGSGYTNMVKGRVSSSGTIAWVWITNNFFAGTLAEAVDIRGTGGNATGVTASGNQIVHNSATGHGFYFENVAVVAALGNSNSSFSATWTDLVKFNSGGDYYTVIGNNSGGGATSPVTDSSGAAHTAIANNI